MKQQVLYNISDQGVKMLSKICGHDFEWWTRYLSHPAVRVASPDHNAFSVHQRFQLNSLISDVTCKTLQIPYVDSGGGAGLASARWRPRGGGGKWGSQRWVASIWTATALCLLMGLFQLWSACFVLGLRVLIACHNPSTNQRSSQGFSYTPHHGILFQDSCVHICKFRHNFSFCYFLIDNILLILQRMNLKRIWLPNIL